MPRVCIAVFVQESLATAAWGGVKVEADELSTGVSASPLSPVGVAGGGGGAPGEARQKRLIYRCRNKNTKYR